MRKELPAGVVEALSVPGLRPEKVMKLYNELGITSLAGLEEFARADRRRFAERVEVGITCTRRGTVAERGGAAAAGSSRSQAHHAGGRLPPRL